MTSQLEYSREEILATDPIAEPLRVGEVVCHGGFDGGGRYVSPRTLNRTPAIAAWQANHRETFGHDILDAPLESFPGVYPNLQQARLLLREGAVDPIVAFLTRIGTVEGFGARIRNLAPGDMQRFFGEDIKGTATSHLSVGLTEAHARDEAGHEEQAGHDRMWFAVRDIAFGSPVTEDQVEVMLRRMGLAAPAPSVSSAATSPTPASSDDLADLDPGLLLLIATMARVLFIEIKAFHIFAWAETLLGDPELVADNGEAARLVSYIRADETPHVDYLRTSLTEMRDRTFVGTSGRRYPGTRVVGTIWDRALEESMGRTEQQNRESMHREVERALESHRRGGEVLAEFETLGTGR